jgi:transcriptional regulator with XRE-family HTH domain
MQFKIDGAVLRRHREELGLSRETLGRMARVSAVTIRQIETRPDYGESFPQTVEALARSLGCRPEELVPEYIPPVPHYPRVRYDQELLKNLRADHGLSISDLACRAGVGESLIRALEGRETAKATPETIYRVAKALGIKPSELSTVLAVSPAPGEREAFEAAAMPLGYPAGI